LYGVTVMCPVCVCVCVCLCASCLSCSRCWLVSRRDSSVSRLLRMQTISMKLCVICSSVSVLRRNSNDDSSSFDRRWAVVKLTGAWSRGLSPSHLGFNPSPFSPLSHMKAYNSTSMHQNALDNNPKIYLGMAQPLSIYYPIWKENSPYHIIYVKKTTFYFKC